MRPAVTHEWGQRSNQSVSNAVLASEYVCDEPWLLVARAAVQWLTMSGAWHLSHASLCWVIRTASRL
jgi:hypothetical protein